MHLPASYKVVLIAVISFCTFNYSKCLAGAFSKRDDGIVNEPPHVNRSPASVNIDSKAATTTTGGLSGNLNLQKSQGNRVTSQDTRFLLAKDPACVEDVMRMCDKSLYHNNFAVLDCIQNYQVGCC